MVDSFHLHCQAGSSDCIGCTIFTDGYLLDSEAKFSPAGFMLVGVGVGGAVNYKQEASVSILFASMHACACEQYAQVSVSNRVVKRFHTLAGSCEQCRSGVRFHPGPFGIVLCLPV